MERTAPGTALLTFSLLADAENPVINPAFVVMNWGKADVEVKLGDRALERGRKFRFGHRHTLAGTDLIVWLEIESTQELPVTFMSQP